MSRVELHKIVLGKSTGGLLVQSGTFPVPRFSTLCVCCDAPAQMRAYDPGDRDKLAGRVDVPLCDACCRHVSLRPYTLVWVAGMAVAIGIFVAVGAVILGSLPWVVIGIALSIGTIAVAVARHQRTHEAALRGHHRDFLIGAGVGFSVVRTTNPRVRDEILAQGGKPLTRRR